MYGIFIYVKTCILYIYMLYANSYMIAFEILQYILQRAASRVSLGLRLWSVADRRRGAQ